jgi:hypothetical protein
MHHPELSASPPFVLASDADRTLPDDVLAPIAATALFYPCSGDDLELPVSLFAPVVSDFVFADLRMPRRLSLPNVAPPTVSSHQGARCATSVHEASGREFRVHRRQHRAEEVLDALPALGVFFFRGDNPVDGEGSSGVLWLGHDLFSRILRLIVPGGLVVTDGSNPGPNGPAALSAFYHNRNVGRAAVSRALPFEYEGRNFTCIGYVGERNGPTLVWRAA